MSKARATTRKPDTCRENASAGTGKESSNCQERDSLSSMNDSQSSGQNIASRFKHLLEPIRDLALNWNVDIAQDLENYLNELELIHISFDGGETKMNFAEAALLIQGSACVYSRKVEYLYQLVFRVMDIIADRQRNANDASNKKDGDPENEFPCEPQFIALDDISEAKSSAIDLVEKEDLVGNHSLSITSSPIMLTMSLEADMDDTNDPNKDFRLASASVHSSGALLLDSRFAALLDGNAANFRRSTWGAGSSVERARAADHSPSMSLSGQNQVIDGHERNEDKLGMEGIPEFQPEHDCQDDSDVDDSYLDCGQNEHRPSDAELECKENRREGCRHPPVPTSGNIWCMLNPHDATSNKEKPFRKGKSYRRPQNITKCQEMDSSICLSQLSVRSHQSRSLRLPYFPDFSWLFLQERNKKLAQKLADARARTVSLPSESMHQLGLMLNLDAGDDYDEIDLPNIEDVEPHNDAVGFGCDADSDDDIGDNECSPILLVPGETPPMAPKSYSGEGGDARECIAQSYEDMCKAYVEKYLSGVEAFLQQSGLAARVSEWQSRLEPRLEAEERRRNFDIHVYGDEVLGRVAAASRGAAAPVAFAQAVRGLPAHDICRSFLATLQLANDGNVDISLADAQDRESILVRVVSGDSRHRAMVTDYVAPSLLSARKKRPKPAPAPSPVQAARLQLDAAGGAASQGECGRGTQASQAPTQEAGAACGASQGRKRAFAARPAAGGKENRPLPQA